MIEAVVVVILIAAVWLVVHHTRQTQLPFVAPPKPTRIFGVQIHPDATVADLDLVAATRATFCRCDIGQDVPFPVIDRIYDGLLTRGLTPLFITSGGAPTTDQAIAEYVAFHAAAAKRYPKAWWEICNEPNVPFFWQHPDPLAYARLVKAIVPVMRAFLDPSSKIISAGTSGIPIPFITAFLSAGVEQLVDYVGFHPYGAAPDRLPAVLNQLRTITSKPLFCTEYGATANQSNALTGMAQACGDAGVPFVWYELKDGKPNILDSNNTYGLYTADGAAKPSLAAAISYANGV
jgi:hypothetical protein